MLAFLESVWIVILSISTAFVFPFNLAIDAIKTSIESKDVEYPETIISEKAEYKSPECVINEKDIFVSVDGDDSMRGKFDCPVATIERAKTIANGKGGTDPVTIWVREGIYNFTETLEKELILYYN